MMRQGDDDAAGPPPSTCLTHARLVGPLVHHALLERLGLQPESDFAFASGGFAAADAQGFAALPPGRRRTLRSLHAEMKQRPYVFPAPSSDLLMRRADGRRVQALTTTEAACASLFLGLRLRYSAASPVLLANATLVPAHACPEWVRREWRTLALGTRFVCWVDFTPRVFNSDAGSDRRFDTRAVIAPDRAVAIEEDALKELFRGCGPKPPATLPLVPSSSSSGARREGSPVLPTTRHRRSNSSRRRRRRSEFERPPIPEALGLHLHSMRHDLAAPGDDESAASDDTNADLGVGLRDGDDGVSVGAERRQQAAVVPASDVIALLLGPRSREWLRHADAADREPDAARDERERRLFAERQRRIAADAEHESTLYTEEPVSPKKPWQLTTPPLVKTRRAVSHDPPPRHDDEAAERTGGGGGGNGSPQQRGDFVSEVEEEADGSDAVARRDRRARWRSQQLLQQQQQRPPPPSQHADRAAAAHRRPGRAELAGGGPAGGPSRRDGSTVHYHHHHHHHHHDGGEMASPHRPSAGSPEPAIEGGLAGERDDQQPQLQPAAISALTADVAAETRRVHGDLSTVGGGQASVSAAIPSDDGAEDTAASPQKDTAVLRAWRDEQLAALKATVQELAAAVAEAQVHAEALNRRVDAVEAGVRDGFGTREDLGQSYGRAAALATSIKRLHGVLANMHYRIYSVGVAPSSESPYVQALVSARAQEAEGELQHHQDGSHAMPHAPPSAAARAAAQRWELADLSWV